MTYNVVIEPSALKDIQQGIDYYDEQQIGLGEKFEEAINKHMISLENNPFFQQRYDDTRCLPVKKYPYMIHFSIDEINRIVTVHAVFHTSLNPEKWGERD